MAYRLSISGKFQNLNQCPMTERPAIATPNFPSVPPAPLIFPRFPFPVPFPLRKPLYLSGKEGAKEIGDVPREQQPEMEGARGHKPGSFDPGFRYLNPPVMGTRKTSQEADPHRKGPRYDEQFPVHGRVGPSFHDPLPRYRAEETAAKAVPGERRDRRASADGASQERHPSHVRRRSGFQHLRDDDTTKAVSQQVYLPSLHARYRLGKPPRDLLQVPGPGRIVVVSHRQARSVKPPSQVPQIPVLPPEAVQKDDGVGTARIRWIAVRQNSPPGELFSRRDFPAIPLLRAGRREETALSY